MCECAVVGCVVVGGGGGGGGESARFVSSVFASECGCGKSSTRHNKLTNEPDPHDMHQKEKEKEKKMDTTPQCSRVVPHPSTDRAQTALTSVIGRERVHYG